jgi:hypothetical protein
MNVIDYNHVYLYAKGHYTTSEDKMLDLKKIISCRSIIEVKHITDMDVVSQLITLVSGHLVNDKYALESFLKSLCPMDSFFTNVFPEKNVNDQYIYSMMDSALSVLRMVKAVDLGGSIGSVDADILPLPVRSI